MRRARDELPALIAVKGVPELDGRTVLHQVGMARNPVPRNVLHLSGRNDTGFADRGTDARHRVVELRR